MDTKQADVVIAGVGQIPVGEHWDAPYGKWRLGQSWLR